ncbi:hypothetical protein FMUND_13515 [Fusarium mundagurra]|uniref:Uncharacterized protein n=1 Tax=Fusarium mundagurra TaxID=1567541 RepID=A0A8H5XZ97_9HYPO|nr:hypothetical protein FMUND_13515 [Fusarium mundagurra]
MKDGRDGCQPVRFYTTTASNRVVLRHLLAQSHTTVAETSATSHAAATLTKEFIFGALDRNSWSSEPPQMRMTEKDKKGATENNPPSIEDLGKIFDDMVQERLGRRDPISRRWQRKTWAPPIWATKSNHLDMQMLPLELTPASKDRQRGPFNT